MSNKTVKHSASRSRVSEVCHTDVETDDQDQTNVAGAGVLG